MPKTIAHEEIAVDSGVKTLSPSIYNPEGGQALSRAVIHAEGGDMRYFVNGEDPSPTSGILLEEGDIVELPTIYHIKNFKVIKVNVSSGKITILYEG